MTKEGILTTDWLNNLPHRVHKISQELETASWETVQQIPNSCMDQLNRLAIELQEMVTLVEELRPKSTHRNPANGTPSHE